MDWLSTDKYPNAKDGRYIVCVSEGDPDIQDDLCEADRKDGLWYYAPVPFDLGDGEKTLLHSDPIEIYEIRVTHYIPWPEHPSHTGYFSQGLNPSNES